VLVYLESPILRIKTEASRVDVTQPYLQSSEKGPIQGVGQSPHLKPTTVALSTMILYNSENSIRYMRSFYLHLSYNSKAVETWLPKITEIAPLTILPGSASGSESAHSLTCATLFFLKPTLISWAAVVRYFLWL